MKSKDFAYAMLWLWLVFMVLAGSGCGGGGGSVGSSPDPDGKNPNGVVLEDVLEPGAEVTVEVVWNQRDEVEDITNNTYVLKFRNLSSDNAYGFGDFEGIDLPSDLPFDAQMSYGTDGISAMFTDKEHSDVYLFFMVDVTKSTYYVDRSDVLSQLWSRYDTVNSFQVNGVEFIDEMDYGWDEWNDEEEGEVTSRYNLEDALEEGGVVTIDFEMGKNDYHYVWRNVDLISTFVKIDSYGRNALKTAELWYTEEGFAAKFVDENASKWAIFSFNKEENTYRISSNVEDVTLNQICVNGEDITEKVMLVSSARSYLGDAILSGAMIRLGVKLGDAEQIFDFVNTGNEDLSLVHFSANVNATLMILGVTMIGSIETYEGETITYLFFLADDSYENFSSSPEEHKLQYLMLNGNELALKEKPISE